MSSDRTAVEDLKRQWLQDPCWDIEDTEGFEMFRDELLAFRLEREAESREAQDKLDAERARRQRAFGRTPVAITKNVWPIVACRDGSVWELTSLPVDGAPSGQRADQWRQLPPIPGSIADLNHDYWTEGGDK